MSRQGKPPATATAWQLPPVRKACDHSIRYALTTPRVWMVPLWRKRTGPPARFGAQRQIRVRYHFFHEEEGISWPRLRPGIACPRDIRIERSPRLRPRQLRRQRLIKRAILA